MGKVLTTGTQIYRVPGYRKTWSWLVETCQPTVTMLLVLVPGISIQPSFI